MCSRSVPKAECVLLVLVAAHLVLNAAVLVPLFGYDNTVLSYIYPGLLKPARADSWSPMYKAYIHARQQPHEPLYEQTFFKGHIKFLYPPSSLLLYAFLDRVYPTADRGVWFRVLNAASLALLAAFPIVLATICSDVEKSCTGPPRRTWAAAAVGTLAWGVATVSFYPAIRGYSLGQIQTWLTVWLAGAMLALLRGNETLAGGLVGTAILIKPYYGLLLLYGAWRRHWRLFWVGCVVAFVGTLVATCRFGLPDLLGYPAILAFIGRRGEAYFPNQSLFGLLHRLFGDADFVGWHPNAYPEASGAMAMANTVFSLGLLGLAFAGRRRSDRVGDTMGFAVATLAVTIASPIAWEYHFAILLPIYAILIPLIAHVRVLGRWRYAVLTSTYLAAGSFLSLARTVAGGPKVATLVLSHLFFAGVAVLAMLVVARAEWVRCQGPQPTALPVPDRTEDEAGCD